MQRKSKIKSPPSRYFLSRKHNMSREDGLQARNFRMRSGRMDRGEKEREMMTPQPSTEVEKLARKERTHLTQGARMQRHLK